MIKKAIKIELEMILTQGFNEEHFIEDLKIVLEEDFNYVDACHLQIMEIHEQVFYDEEAMDTEN